MASCGKQYPMAQAAAYHYPQQPYAPVSGAPVTGVPLTNQVHNSTELPPPLFGTPADDSYNTQAPPQQQCYQKSQEQQQPAYAPASNNAYPNIEPTQSQNGYSVPYYAQYPYQQHQQQQQALYSASNNNNNNNYSMHQGNVSAQAPYTYAAPPPAALNTPQDQGNGIDEAQQAPPQHQKSRAKSLFSYLNTAMDYRDKSLQQASQFWSEARHTGQRFVGRSSPPQRDDLEARRRYRERYGEEPK